MIPLIGTGRWQHCSGGVSGASLREKTERVEGLPAIDSESCLKRLSFSLQECRFETMGFKEAVDNLLTLHNPSVKATPLSNIPLMGAVRVSFMPL
jgi:hypothetical protein